MRQVDQGVLELILVSHSFRDIPDERTRRVTSHNMGITMRIRCTENIMLRTCRFLLPAIPGQGCVSETDFNFRKRVDALRLEDRKRWPLSNVFLLVNHKSPKKEQATILVILTGQS